MRSPMIDAGDLPGSATRLIESVEPGEELEIYLSKSRELEVRAFDGSIESLSEATTAGVGVRVIRGGRQGFAYAGALDDDAFLFALAEARDNAQFATPDECVGLATPDGVPAPSLNLVEDDVESTSVEAKIALALDMEHRARCADPRIRQVTSADYADFAGEHAIVTSTGIDTYSRRTACRAAVVAVAGDEGEGHSGYGVSAGRGVGSLDPDAVVNEAVERSIRITGSTSIRSRNCVVVLDPRVSATFLGLLGAALSGEATGKGRSMFTG